MQALAAARPQALAPAAVARSPLASSSSCLLARPAVAAMRLQQQRCGHRLQRRAQAAGLRVVATYPEPETEKARPIIVLSCRRAAPARRRRLLPAAPHRQHVAAAAAAAATECFTPRAHHGCRSHCFACLQERSPIDFPQVRIRADGYKLVDLCTAGSVAVLLQHLGEGACRRRAGRRRRCLPPRLLLPRPRRGCSLPCSPLPLPSAGVDHAAAQPPPRHLPRV